jgi:site-specific DNA-methyltransferase (cytosine-N4-specific)
MIFREIYRVLKPTGTFWLNIGDTYAGSNCGRNDYRKKTMIGVDTSRYQKTSPQSRVTYKRKSLMLIPERLVLRLVDEVGFILRNKIIWYKPNHMPNSVKDRLTNTWEYVYLLVKKPRYYFNLDAIRVPHTSLRDIRRLKKHGGLNVRLTFRKKWNGQKTQSAFIAMNPNGKNPGDIIGTKHDIAVGRIGRYSYSDPLHVKDYHPKGKNPGDTINSKYMDEQIHVYAPAWKKYAPRTTHENESNLGDYWPMTTEPFKDAHFAVFPKKLIVPMILAGCPPNGIVLDPFMGSGTVAVVVELINRGLWDDLNYEPNKIAKKIKWNLKWIGIEIVKEYVDMAYRRLHPLRNYTLIEEIFGLKKMVCIG